MPLHRFTHLLRNQRGAVDLPSIMVGAIVLGLLTAAILATVFTVIPWAQDNAAKQKAGQLASAQMTYYAMSTDASVSVGGSDPHYASVHQLVDEDLVTIESGQIWPVSAGGVQTSMDSASKVKFVVGNGTAADLGRDYFTIDVRSDTGAVFTSTEADPQPRPGTF